MKKRIFAFMAVMSLAVGVVPADRVVEEIVAIVNNDVITLSQYKDQFDNTVQQLRATLKGEEYEKQYAWVKTEMLNMLINDLLLMQQAKEKNLNVSEQLKMAIENIKKENQIESDDELKRGLREQGLNYDYWIKQLEENLLRQAVVYSEIDRNIVLDDSEVVGYYKLHPEEFTDPEEYHLRAVYLSSEGQSASELEEKKREIGDKAGSGETFNALAKQYSEGPARESEGDLGVFRKGELAKTLEQAVSGLKPGEMSGWIETKNGWYLLKLEDRKESRLKTYDEVKKDVEGLLYSRKRQELSEKFLKDLKERSYIKILKPNPLD